MKLYLWIVVLIGLVTPILAQPPAAIKAYQAGVDYHRLRNYEQAKGFFETAIQEDPTFINAHRSLIDCEERLGNRKAAIQAYIQAIQIAPSDKKLCYNLALVYVDVKEYNQATIYLKKALRIDPLYNRALDRLEEIEDYLNRKERQKTEHDLEEVSVSKEQEAYQKALNAYREERYQLCLETLEAYAGEITLANFYYLNAITTQQLEQRAAAQKLYKQALLIDAEHFNSNLNLGRMFYNDQNYATAVGYLEKAYEKRAKDEKLLYDLAKTYHYNQQHQLAVKKLELYTARNANDGEAWRLLGSSYSQLGKTKSAASAFDKAKKYGVGNDDLYERIAQDIADKGNKARSLTKIGKYNAAIEVLEQAIEEHPKEVALCYNLGLNYLEIGNVKKAQIQFIRTVELDPEHAKAYQALGMLHYEREEFQTAGAYYLTSIEAGKQDEYLYYQMGNCWFKLKQFERAIEAYNKAVAINDQEKNFFFSLGSAQLALNQQYKAIDNMKKALALDPQYWEAQYNIAVAYFKMSEYEQCMTEAEVLLKQNPNYAKAYLIIGHSYHRMRKYGLARKYQEEARRLDPTLKL
ncbi:MAG: tetratricopeptide repeat protein [Aureispira sp.]